MKQKEGNGHMAKVWRVIIVALLAAAVVMAFNFAGEKSKSPADNAAVQKTSAKPAAEKPEPAKSERGKSAPAEKTEEAAVEKPAKEPVKDGQPGKKPPSAPKPKVLPKIVDVGGENCIPCKLMVPILDEVRAEYKGKLEVVTISKNEDPGAMKRYRVSTIPTQIFYGPDGKEIARHFGFIAKDDILDTFKKHGVEL